MHEFGEMLVGHISVLLIIFQNRPTYVSFKYQFDKYQPWTPFKYQYHIKKQKAYPYRILFSLNMRQCMIKQLRRRK